MLSLVPPLAAGATIFLYLQDMTLDFEDEVGMTDPFRLDPH